MTEKRGSDPVEETQALTIAPVRQFMNFADGTSLSACCDRTILKFFVYSSALGD